MMGSDPDWFDFYFFSLKLFSHGENVNSSRKQLLSLLGYINTVTCLSF